MAKKKERSRVGKINTWVGVILSLLIGAGALQWSFKLFDLGALTFTNSLKVYVVSVLISGVVFYGVDYIANKLGWDI